MTDSELVEIVDELRRAGRDNQHVEAKTAATTLPRNVRHTLSAFSNTSGGVIVLGIDESAGFAASGVADATAMCTQLSEVCADQMSPPVRAVIETHSFESVDLVTAEVPAIGPGEKPCFIKAAGITNGSYVRVSDSDRKLTSYEVQLLMEDRGQPRHDEEPVSDTSLADLDDGLLAAYFDRISATRPRLADLDIPERLVSARIVTGESGEVSLGALLAFSAFPQVHFPQMNLTFVRYANDDGSTGDDGIRFIDNVTLDGPVTGIISDLESVLRRNMARRGTVEGIRRTDEWEYPETAVREAVVNGLVHRDLSPAARGTPVQVEMYPNRLVVRSPGGLFGPVSVEDLGEGVSSSRNAALLRLLEDTPIPGETSAVCENRGSGIRTMLAALRSAGLQPPQFVDKVSSFSVTFPNHALLSEEVVSWIGSLGQDGLTESQVIGLALMRSGVVLDNPKYRSATGVDSRIATIELQDLVGREIAVQHGVKRWAQYSLPQDGEQSGAAESAVTPPRSEPGDRRLQILSALGDETLSRAELAKRTGLKDRVVRHWLKVLREEGAIERTTKETQSIRAEYRALLPGQVSLFEDD